jgi:predicted PurR-regulated permease PerM
MTERLYLSSRAKATILWLAVAITLVFLWEVRPILTPFIWAFITAYVLTPVVVFLSQRTGLPRRLWAVLFYLLLLGLLIWGLGTLVPLLSQQFAELIKELPAHIKEAGRALQNNGFLSRDSSVIDVLGTRIDLNASDNELRRQLSVIITEQFGRSALPALAHGFEGILKLLVYLVSTFFLLLEMDRIGDGIARLTPTAVRDELGPWVRRINHVLSAYIRGQLILVVLMSVTTFIGLSLLGVRYAPLLAIFTGLVETMPFVGPYIAGATSVLVALTQGSAPFGWTPVGLAIAVAAMYTVLRQLEDNFVMPFLIGRLVHLHPLVVIFSVLAGAALGGILGLLLAVPAAATVKIVSQYLNGKLREELPRTLVALEPTDNWDAITNRIRQAVLLSKFNGASRPHLLISAEAPPSVLLDPNQFGRVRLLLDESRADAVVLTSDPTLLKLAEEAGIPVETKAEVPSSTVSAPPPDYEEGSPGRILNRLRREQEEGESAAGTGVLRRSLRATGPLSHPKEADEERPV